VYFVPLIAGQLRDRIPEVCTGLLDEVAELADDADKLEDEEAELVGLVDAVAVDGVVDKGEGGEVEVFVESKKAALLFFLCAWIPPTIPPTTAPMTIITATRSSNSPVALSFHHRFVADVRASASDAD
jgi:hypothetical protein